MEVKVGNLLVAKVFDFDLNFPDRSIHILENPNLSVPQAIQARLPLHPKKHFSPIYLPFSPLSLELKLVSKIKHESLTVVNVSTHWTLPSSKGKTQNCIISRLKRQHKTCNRKLLLLRKKADSNFELEIFSCRLLPLNYCLLPPFGPLVWQLEKFKYPKPTHTAIKSFVWNKQFSENGNSRCLRGFSIRFHSSQDMTCN